MKVLMAADFFLPFSLLPLPSDPWEVNFNGHGTYIVGVGIFMHLQDAVHHVYLVLNKTDCLTFFVERTLVKTALHHSLLIIK